jgi:hypothetical protein
LSGGEREWATEDGFFYPSSRSTTMIARRAGMGAAPAVLLSTLPARLAWAAYTRRRVPMQTARLHWRALRDRVPVAPTTIAVGERRFRGAVLVVVGPGEHDAFAELIESIRHYEGEDIKIVAADDATGQYPEELVTRRFPGVDFVRARVPGGNASCSFRTQQRGFLHVLEHYDVPVILKLDPDSLVIGSGGFELARARFDADPGLGVLGTTERDASGTATDYRFSVWMAHTEFRWSWRWRRLANRARRRVNPLRFAQGGAYFVARRALEAAREHGVLPFRQPAWSLLTEDLTTAMVIQAAGFRVGSFGAPGDPVASDTTSLPIEPREALERGVKVVHSVRGTPSGASEAEVRRVFAAARAAPPRSASAAPPEPLAHDGDDLVVGREHRHGADLQ